MHCVYVGHAKLNRNYVNWVWQTKLKLSKSPGNMFAFFKNKSIHFPRCFSIFPLLRSCSHFVGEWKGTLVAELTNKLEQSKDKNVMIHREEEKKTTTHTHTRTHTNRLLLIIMKDNGKGGRLIRAQSISIKQMRYAHWKQTIHIEYVHCVCITICHFCLDSFSNHKFFSVSPVPINYHQMPSITLKMSPNRRPTGKPISSNCNTSLSIQTHIHPPKW